ncbi:MAG: site-2 protease family protein [Verrucomicrobiales bacterium]|nr:site-2 protease family protein [Verrucomicrobiales bacterium]
MIQFTLLGYPVRVHWTFWLVSAMMSGAFSMQGREMFLHLLLWTVAVFVSILWHELGHAQAYRKYGGHAEILLYSMGGLCSGTGRGGFTRHESMWISAAGPAASIFLFGIVLAVAWFTPLAQQSRIGAEMIGNLLWINGFWTVVNLLPVMPLDGGQIFQAFMSNKNPRVVPYVGMAVAIGVAIAGLFYGLIFMAIFFGFLAHSNWERSKGRHAGFW